MKYKYEMAGKKIISKALAILVEAEKIIDEGAYFISLEKLKRETSYLDGDPRRLSNNIYGLERSGYIRINRKSRSIELTSKGRIKLLEHLDNNEADGKWRMLSFDIPENLATKRDTFRRSIKRIGYKQAQKSLWVSPFVKSDEVYLIIDDLRIRKYIAYIVAEKTDIEQHLKQLFKKELE